MFLYGSEAFDGKVPEGEPSEEIRELAEKAALNYESNMARKEFHLVIYAVDDYIES